MADWSEAVALKEMNKIDRQPEFRLSIRDLLLVASKFGEGGFVFKINHLREPRIAISHTYEPKVNEFQGPKLT